VLPRIAAIWEFVMPCQTMVATTISLALNCSRGEVMNVLLLQNCGGQELSALLDPGAQEKGAQGLFYGARTDLQLGCNFFVAAAFDQQIQHLLIAPGDFDLRKIQH
jgi:hypothetical protein